MQLAPAEVVAWSDPYVDSVIWMLRLDAFGAGAVVLPGAGFAGAALGGAASTAASLLGEDPQAMQANTTAIGRTRIKFTLTSPRGMG